MSRHLLGEGDTGSNLGVTKGLVVKKAGGMGMFYRANSPKVKDFREIVLAMLCFSPPLLMLRTTKICLHFIGTKLIRMFFEYVFVSFPI